MSKEQNNQSEEITNVSHVHGFGTFKGVYVPSVLTIFGVIMYLRIGWVVGNAGVFGTVVIVTLASAITFLTALSISATATNMRVGGGGAYYMISRSFGIEAGAAIGLPLFFAQTLGVSFYIAGFSESIHTFFPWLPIPLIGTIILVILTYLAYVSAELALKTQMLILILIILSLVSFFMGDAPAEGFNTESIPSQLVEVPFWTIFAVFFPAVTGIEAGISMSGNLKNPGKSLPWGTIAAVLTGYVVYLAIPIFLNQKVPSEVLKTDFKIVQELAKYKGLIFLGIWGATLSSALGALLGAPRTLQALARDRVLPQFLGKGFGKGDEPRIATGISFVIALVGIWLGSLDVIAPVLSMFFLTSYGFLNLAAGIEGLIGNPSWRPKFNTPWYLSLLGAFGCVAIMFMINPGVTFIALFLTMLVYLIMRERDLQTRWTDIRHSILSFLARHSIYKLSNFKVDARSWRPNLLVLSGAPTSRWYLVKFANSISHGKGFLTVAGVFSKNQIKDDRVANLESSVKEFLRQKGVQALVEISIADSSHEGFKSIIRNYGLGPIVPNTFVLGETEKEENFVAYSELIQMVYRSRRNVLIVREPVESEKNQIATDGWTKKIDVWWGREKQNAGLMLTVGYMLQTSPEWVGSELTLKTLSLNEEERQSAIEHLEKFVKKGRLGAEIEVLVKNPQEDPIQTISRYSKEADLVILGIRPPEENETAEQYSVYYAQLLERTQGFSRLALVLTGEQIEFEQIFE